MGPGIRTAEGAAPQTSPGRCQLLVAHPVFAEGKVICPECCGLGWVEPASPNMSGLPRTRSAAADVTGGFFDAVQESRMPNWIRAAWMILVVVACVGLALVGLRFARGPTRKPGAGLMRPAMDLRRVIVPRDVVRVAEQSSQRLELVTDGWILRLNAIEADHIRVIFDANRRMVQSLPASREDVLQVSDSLVVHRFLFGVKGLSCAESVHYVVSFGDGLGWAHGWGTLRDVGATLDVTPFDAVLLALRLIDKPRLDLEVPPAWLAYQSNRTAGSPIAKFVLSPEAPVLIGRDEVMDRDQTRFSDDDFRHGGRQVTPELIEFYTKGDPIFFVRLDVWLNPRPAGRRADLREYAACGQRDGFDSCVRRTVPRRLSRLANTKYRSAASTPAGRVRPC